MNKGTGKWMDGCVVGRRQTHMMLCFDFIVQYGEGVKSEVVLLCVFLNKNS